MRTSEEHIDLMLFDYLEGNLTARKAAEVEAKINSDPLIKEELDVWRQSYIQPDYSPIPALESPLLQNPGPFSFTLFLNSILVICITLISSTNPTLDPYSTSMANNQNILSLTAKQPYSQLSYPIINIEPLQVESTVINTPSHKVTNGEVGTIKYDFNAIPGLEKLSPEWAQYSRKQPIFIEIKEAIALPTITTKELRKKERGLSRMKKKALRDRVAYEFIKGDIPYVVPVNPNNF